MGMKSVSFLAAAVFAGALLPGCASRTGDLESNPVKSEVDRQFRELHPSTGDWLAVWGMDRWYDLTDVLSWDIGFGRGFGVNGHLTEFAQAGIGWWDGTHWGSIHRSWGVWEEDKVERGLGPFYWIELEREAQYGTDNLFDMDYKFVGWDLFEESGDKRTDHDWSEVGGSARLFAVGAGASASPIEAVDFVAGLFPVGLVANVAGYHHPIFDIMGDDAYSRLQDDLQKETGLGAE